ncbi:MAG: polyprenyl synthetase family protein [Nitrospirae bacterium]|nr:polyprenyl synthetase family protein [Nitrospirota bacterium]
MLNYHRTVDIQRVFDAYEAELLLVEEKLKKMLQSNALLIPFVGAYILNSGGKRLRPLFLLSSARFAGYKGNDHISLASIIELIHTASLLHDDVVDAAQLRRGMPTAHSVWGNQVVILVGDFLYSNALKTAVSFGNQKVMEALSHATTSMTEGELFQLQKSGDTEITEAEYRRIISAKTGILISSACRIGAIIGGMPSREEDALARFGLKAGTAFQMADDVLDYMAEEGELGKRLGKDLEEGKVTLPLIYLLQSASTSEKQEVKDILSRELSDNGLKRILMLFRHYNVIEESMKRASGLVEDAKSELSIFQPSSHGDEMFELADYALMRQN